MKKKLSDFKSGEHFRHPKFGLCMATPQTLPAIAVMLEGEMKGQSLHVNMFCPGSLIPEFEVMEAPSMEPTGPKSSTGFEYSQTPTSLETGGRNALNLQMARELIRKHFIFWRGFMDKNKARMDYWGSDEAKILDALQSVQSASDGKKCLSEKGPKSDAVAGASSTEPSDPYYGAWREDDDLILFKLPGHEEFRLSNTAAERLYQDFAKIVRKPSPSEANAQAMEDKQRLDWLEDWLEKVDFDNYSTVREAIDAAMPLPSTIKEQPPQKDLGEQ